MELERFKETLLEFLSDVTYIPEKTKATFLNSHKDDSWIPNKAPHGYNVLTPYLLVKETIHTKKYKKPQTTPEEGHETIWKEPKEDIFHYTVIFKIYTETNCYHIGATWKEYHPQFLWCGGDTRKFRVGENWTRGNDLSDGYFCRETWKNIKNRIIKYEMKALSKYIANGRWTPPQADEVPIKTQKA